MQTLVTYEGNNIFICMYKHAAYLYINAVEDVDHVLVGGPVVTVPRKVVEILAYNAPPPAQWEMRKQCATDLLGRLCSDLVQLGEVISPYAYRRIMNAAVVLVIDGYTVNLLRRVG